MGKRNLIMQKKTTAKKWPLSPLTAKDSYSAKESDVIPLKKF